MLKVINRLSRARLTGLGLGLLVLCVLSTIACFDRTYNTQSQSLSNGGGGLTGVTELPPACVIAKLRVGLFDPAPC